MIIHPYRDPQRMAVYPGTRLLQEHLDLVGIEIEDLTDRSRRWTIQSLHAPIPGRVLGGIRAKLIDSKDFITFCNQRDLEVLIGLECPGEWCKWAGHVYRGPEDEGWFGLCADEDDLRDDLQSRELTLRTYAPSGVLFPPLTIERRVHLEPKYDVEEHHVLLHDVDPNTGFFPDPRLETIERRWIRSHRERVRWNRL